MQDLRERKIVGGSIANNRAEELETADDVQGHAVRRCIAEAVDDLWRRLLQAGKPCH